MNTEKNTCYESQPQEDPRFPVPVEKAPRNKRGGLRRLTTLVLSAVLFGTVSAGSFYGVSCLLPQGEGGAAAGGAVNMASTSYSSTRYGMDVSDIAAAALPSVVSITNISVQEVQSYFNRFGPRRLGTDPDGGDHQLRLGGHHLPG